MDNHRNAPEFGKSSPQLVFNESNLYSNIPKPLHKYLRVMKNNSEKQGKQVE